MQERKWMKCTAKFSNTRTTWFVIKIREMKMKRFSRTSRPSSHNLRTLINWTARCWLIWSNNRKKFRRASSLSTGRWIPTDTTTRWFTACKKVTSWATRWSSYRSTTNQTHRRRECTRLMTSWCCFTQLWISLRLMWTAWMRLWRYVCLRPNTVRRVNMGEITEMVMDRMGGWESLIFDYDTEA